MKKTIYFVMGLFIVSLAFAAGHSFSQTPYLPTFGSPQGSAMVEYGTGTPRPPFRPIPYTNITEGTSIYLPPDARCVVSAMISSELKSPQGHYLAEISDLVIDPANGHVSNIVLSRVRGMGAKSGVIPFSAVTKTGGAIYVYDAPEDTYRFIGEVPYQSGGWGLNLSAEHKPAAGLTASRLIGAPVRTSKGEDLGRIEDLIIDHMSGNVVSLVASGTKGKPVLVPFNALSESGKGGFTVKSS